jgi:hypothetical protein
MMLPSVTAIFWVCLSVSDKIALVVSGPIGLNVFSILW